MLIKLILSYNKQVAQRRDYNVSNIEYNSVPSDRIQFTGIKEKFINIFRRPAKIDEETYRFIDFAADVLSIQKTEMHEITSGASSKQLTFLDSMIHRYNSRNWKKPASEKESPDVVIDLFQRIKDPKEGHFGLINDTNLCMTDIKHCFDKLEDNALMLNQARISYHKLKHFSNRRDMLMEMVDSPNHEKYLKHASLYLLDKTSNRI